MSLLTAQLGTVSQPAVEAPFTVVMVPDTQHVTKYGTHLDELYQYIVDQKDEMNIKMVLPVGDIVSSFGTANNQWTKAEDAFDIIRNADIAMLPAIGNHDYEASDYLTTRLSTDFDSLVDLTYMRTQDWFIDEQYSGATNMAALMTLGGKKHLFVTIEFRPRTAAVDWAHDLIDDYHDDVDYVWINTHHFLGGDGVRVDNTQTDYIWDELSGFSKLRVIMCGHTYGSSPATEGTPAEARRQDGNIMQMVLNYQYESGNNYDDSGLLRFLTVDPETNIVSVTTYNPLTEEQFTDSNNQFTFSL